MYKLDVYDMKNTDRLLGTLMVNPFMGAYLEIPVLPATCPPYAREQSRIIFKSHWKEVESEGDFANKKTTSIRVLLTDAPLSVLTYLDRFEVSTCDRKK